LFEEDIITFFNGNVTAGRWDFAF